jgi:Ni,Fe-hydrogenase I cytochrome b subunit
MLLTHSLLFEVFFVVGAQGYFQLYKLALSKIEERAVLSEGAGMLNDKRWYLMLSEVGNHMGNLNPTREPMMRGRAVLIFVERISVLNSGDDMSSQRFWALGKFIATQIWRPLF